MARRIKFRTYQELEAWHSEQMDVLTERYINNNWSNNRLDKEQDKLSDLFHEYEKDFVFVDESGNRRISNTRIK